MHLHWLDLLFDTILWSGRNDNQHREGVAMIIPKQYKNSLLEWKPSANAWCILGTAPDSSSFPSCYAPTDEEEDERRFLQQHTGSNGKHHKPWCYNSIGDLNARVCSKNERTERSMGKEGIGYVTDNGSRPCDFCKENDLVIGGQKRWSIHS